jgi:propanol-preferring alcohol dehydrogenase
MELIGKGVTLRGSGGGQPKDTAAVLGYMGKGELAIEVTTIAFSEIPEGLKRLEQGSVIGRLVAEFN